MQKRIAAIEIQSLFIFWDCPLIFPAQVVDLTQSISDRRRNRFWLGLPVISQDKTGQCQNQSTKNQDIKFLAGTGTGWFVLFGTHFSLQALWR